MRRAAGLVAAASALLPLGCGGDGSTQPIRVVERTTTVEVVRRQGEPSGFDAQAVYERDAPGVVTVSSVFGGRGGGLLRLEGGSEGVGSGFVLDGQGAIATNAHVVTSGEGSGIREADEVFVAFGDGNQVPAEIVGFDPNSDLALLRIDPAGLTLRPLPLGSASDVRVGEPVAAIGSPYGEPQSLAVGVVSAVDRTIESLTGFAIAGALQTDAPINRGNSGGPLVDGAGRVLGINSQIRSTGGGAEGVGYAVSADTARRVLERLREDGEVDYSYLGVRSRPVYPQLAERFDLGTRRGAWVQEVVEGGPAADAGLRGGEGRERFQATDYAVGGDVVTRVQSTPVRDAGDLAQALIPYAPGETVTLEIWRGADRRLARVRLAERPEDGVASQPRP